MFVVQKLLYCVHSFCAQADPHIPVVNPTSLYKLAVNTEGELFQVPRITSALVFLISKYSTTAYFSIASFTNYICVLPFASNIVHIHCMYVCTLIPFLHLDIIYSCTITEDNVYSMLLLNFIGPRTTEVKPNPKVRQELDVLQDEFNAILRLALASFESHAVPLSIFRLEVTNLSVSQK